MSWELTLSIDRTARSTLASQLRGAIRRSVETGTLKPGARLPSTRQLATDLDISRSVVVEAYEQLIAEGYLISRRGSGTAVAAIEIPPPTPTSTLAPSAPVRGLDLRTGTGDASRFPRDEWLRCLTEAIRNSTPRELASTYPSGMPVTRQVLASYLGRTRGVQASTEDLIITAGFAQGLSLLCRVLGSWGMDAVGVEDPGHPGERDFIASAGIRPVPIPVDEEGLRVEHLETTGVRVVLVTPAGHFPTGTVLSASRRTALIDWARRVDGLVIEDDFNGLLRSYADRLPALHHLAPDRVVHAGSASKLLSPMLRLGWLTAPSHVLAEIERVRATLDLGMSGMDQLALARFIDTGRLDRHLRRIRPELRKRRDTVQSAVARYLPGARVEGGEGCMAAYITLPPGGDEDALVEAARRRSVLLRGGRFYALTDGPAPPAVVASYASVKQPDLFSAFHEIGRAFAGLSRKPASAATTPA